MNYVTLDIETSGLNSDIAEIIEIGACKVVDSEVVDTFSSLIKPQIVLSPQAENLTGFSPEFFASAPSVDEVMCKFADFAESNTIVAYNSQFIKEFLQAAYAHSNLRCEYEWIDIYKLAKQKLQGKIKCYRMWELCRYYKVPDARSGCFADSIVTHKIYQKLLAEQ